MQFTANIEFYCGVYKAIFTTSHTKPFNMISKADAKFPGVLPNQQKSSST